jgi:MerR HTH family regulatory protein
MRNDFSTFDIMKALSFKRDKLRSWMREGFIKPKYPAEGQGTKAIFTRWDVYGVALFKDLIDHGYKRKAIAEYVHNFVRGEEKSQNPEVEVILFRHEVVKGKTQVDSMAITKRKVEDKGLWVMEIRTGRLGTYNEDRKWFSILPDLRQKKDVNFDPENWDHIHLVNFKKLKKNIDAALSEL